MRRAASRAENGGEFASAERRRQPARIAVRARMSRKRAIDHRPLAREALLVEAGPAAGKALGAAAEQRGRQRRGARGVADAHFAETDEIGVGGHRRVAFRDGGEECVSVHRGRAREVGGRRIEHKRNHAQVRLRRPRQLIDRQPPAAKLATICAVTSAG